MYSGASATSEPAEKIPTDSPLKRIELNVVGEYHSESDTRRRQEKDYMLLYIGLGSKYWKENEFRERDLTDAEKNDPNYVDKRPFADPFKLRFLQYIKFLEKDTCTTLSDALKEIEKHPIISEDDEADFKESLDIPENTQITTFTILTGALPLPMRA